MGYSEALGNWLMKQTWSRKSCGTVPLKDFGILTIPYYIKEDILRSTFWCLSSCVESSQLWSIPAAVMRPNSCLTRLLALWLYFVCARIWPGDGPGLKDLRQTGAGLSQAREEKAVIKMTKSSSKTENCGRTQSGYIGLIDSCHLCFSMKKFVWGKTSE